MFEVRFSTTRYAPPRQVAMVTPGNNWQDIPGTYVDGGWVFALDETQLWNKLSYFKFVLDQRIWMDDPYIGISPSAGSTYNFDESRVTFSLDPESAVVPTLPVVVALPTGAAPSAVSAFPAGAGVAVASVLPTVPAVQGLAAPPTAPTLQAVSALPTTLAIPNPERLLSELVAPVAEGATTNRKVILATPFVTAAAAWLAGLVAHHIPGVTLDQTQVVSFMIAIVAVCGAGAWKWLQGWQQHELLVAQRLAAPIKPVIGTILAASKTAQQAEQG